MTFKLPNVSTCLPLQSHLAKPDGSSSFPLESHLFKRILLLQQGAQQQIIERMPTAIRCIACQ